MAINGRWAHRRDRQRERRHLPFPVLAGLRRRKLLFQRPNGAGPMDLARASIPLRLGRATSNDRKRNMLHGDGMLRPLPPADADPAAPIHPAMRALHHPASRLHTRVPLDLPGSLAPCFVVGRGDNPQFFRSLLHQQLDFSAQRSLTHRRNQLDTSRGPSPTRLWEQSTQDTTPRESTSA